MVDKGKIDRVQAKNYQETFFCSAFGEIFQEYSKSTKIQNAPAHL